MHVFFSYQLSHNKLLINVFWRLVSALGRSHHQTTTQGEGLHPVIYRVYVFPVLV